MVKRLHPALLSLILLLELPFLGQRPLVRDETTSIEVAQRHWGAFWQLLHHLDAPLGFYYLLLRPVVALSDGAFAVRLPSLAGAIAAVAILTATVDRRFGRRAATWAALVLLANPGLWLFADFARPYALALAMAALSLYVLLVSPQRTVLYFVAALLTVYLQLLFGLFLAAQGVLLVHQRRYRLVAALGLAAGAALPVLVLSSGETVMTSWIPYTTVGSLREEAIALLGDAGRLSSLIGLLYVVLVAAALRLREARLLFVLGAVPAGVLVVAGLWMHVLGGRYALYLLLVVAAAAGLGLADLQSRPLQAGAATLVVLAVAASAVHLARIDYVQEDLQSAAAYLVAHDQPGDALLYDPDWARPGMEYWLGRTASGKPDDIAVRTGTVAATTGNLFLPEKSTQDIERALVSRNRVWVVGYPGQLWRPTRNPSGDVAGDLEKTWTSTVHVTFGEIELRLLQRPPSPA